MERLGTKGHGAGLDHERGHESCELCSAEDDEVDVGVAPGPEPPSEQEREQRAESAPDRRADGSSDGVAYTTAAEEDGPHVPESARSDRFAQETEDDVAASCPPGTAIESPP